MKTKILNTALFALLSLGNLLAQDVTSVRANSSDISDNLDLQAVASIFGDSRDLEDFERRLNDPDIQISNLDLNGDSRVDYLRVIEVTENNTHLIILQSVLAADTFQDVATIEVERDRNNNVTVQVVGDTYMYGPNYIYEPVYVTRPALFNVFWVSSYRPYYSPWYWGYYPTYYNYWAPYPVYRYRNNVHNHINVHNTYVYVNNRRSTRATSLYASHRANAYERQYPNRSFANRNTGYSNRREMEQSRTATAATRTGGTRGNASVRSSNNGGGRSTNTVRSNNGAGRAVNNSATRSESTNVNTRSANNSASTRDNGAVRSNSLTRNESQPARANSNTSTRNSSVAPSRTYSAPEVRSNTPSRVNSSPSVRSNTNSAPAVRNTPVSVPQRQSAPSVAPQRQSAPAMRSAPPAAPQRQSAPARSSGGNGGGGRRG